MRPTGSPRELDCAIVGGGVHGTYLAQRLLAETQLERAAVGILDPHERLLASFREKARACGMEALRSSYVHHLGTEPFGLENFAEATDREDELVPTVDYPPRPTLELFLDYADHVIDSGELDSLHHQMTIESIHENPCGSGVRLETSGSDSADGIIDARYCILAIGQGGRYRWPDWATGVAGIEHVWDGFDPDADVDHTVVVGGGITAGQLACELSETGSVTLLTRHPLEWETVEAEPPWLNWSHVEKHLHVHPPGSKARFDAVVEARNDATMAPYLYDELDARLEAGRLRIEEGDVHLARSNDGTVSLFLERGTAIVADRVVLATGFAPVFRHPFVDRVADELGLARGHRGMPILDDATLAWQRENGRSTSLFVSGALALGTVGPYAPNIPGARRAADRITKTIERRERRRERTRRADGSVNSGGRAD